MASEQSESSSGHATHRPRDETTIGSGKFSVEAEIEREEEDYDTDLENVDYESFVNGKSLRKDLTSLKESQRFIVPSKYTDYYGVIQNTRNRIVMYTVSTVNCRVMR